MKLLVVLTITYILLVQSTVLAAWPNDNRRRQRHRLTSMSPEEQIQNILPKIPTPGNPFPNMDPNDPNTMLIQTTLKVDNKFNPIYAYVPDFSKGDPDIALYAFQMAKEVFPRLDINKYLKIIDEMVEDIKKMVKDNPDPDFRIRVMNTYLFKVQGFHYDQDDLLGKKLKNRYLNGLLDTKSGSCTTLPLLYLVLAQRLGYPIYPVAAPQHLFCRYTGPNCPQPNIDPAAMGSYTSNEEYAFVLQIPVKGIEVGTYLKTMTYKQYVGDLLGENGTHWARRGKIEGNIKFMEKGIRYMEGAVRLNPYAAEMYRVLGIAYQDLKKMYEYAKIHQKDNAPQPLNARDIQNQVIGKTLYESLLMSSLSSRSEGAMKKARELWVAPHCPDNYWLVQKERQQLYNSMKALWKKE